MSQKMLCVLGVLFLVLTSQMLFPGFGSQPLEAGSLAIIRLDHRAAEEALPVVQQLLTPAGTATADARTNSLVVVDEETALARVQKFLDRFDLPAAHLRVHVRFVTGSKSEEGSIRAAGRIDAGDVTIGTPSAKQEGVKVTIDTGRSVSDERSEYNVLVTSGSPALIRTGTDIPYRTTWMDLTRRFARIGSHVEFHRIDTGFEVRPTLVGDHVLLEITPRISGLSDTTAGSRGQVIRYTEASTRTRAPLGQWIPIGGARQEKNRAFQAILHAGEGGGQETEEIFLKIEKETKE